jgi:hypothetical protein
MRKSLICVISAAMATGAAFLSPVTASAAGPATGTLRSSAVAQPPDPDTTVTLTVTTGALSMTAPSSADLGSGAPGTTIGPTALGSVTVTDNRALSSASWSATASSTAFTGSGTAAGDTIPASAATYNPGSPTTTGTITVTPHTVTLSGTPQAVVDGTAGHGNNSAAWNPTIAVAVPASAVGGPFSATLSQSVS